MLRLREDALWYAPLHIDEVYADGGCCGRIFLKGCLAWEGVNDKGFLAPLREGAALVDALDEASRMLHADKGHLLLGPSAAAIEELCAARRLEPAARPRPACCAPPPPLVVLARHSNLARATARAAYVPITTEAFVLSVLKLHELPFATPLAEWRHNGSVRKFGLSFVDGAQTYCSGNSKVAN